MAPAKVAPRPREPLPTTASLPWLMVTEGVVAKLLTAEKLTVPEPFLTTVTLVWPWVASMRKGALTDQLPEPAKFTVLAVPPPARQRMSEAKVAVLALLFV